MAVQVFKKEWLKDVIIVKRPMSKAAFRVAQNVSERNYIAPTEPGKNGKYIVTLKAVAADQIDRLKELFRNRDEVPIEETNGIFMTASIWENQEGVTPDLPIRGEEVLCNVDYVMNKEKTQRLLRVVGQVGLQKVDRTAQTIDDSFWADPEPSEEMEEASNDVLQKAK